MYDSIKIKEILAETEKQTKILDEIDKLNSQIINKKKIIEKNYRFKRLLDETNKNLTKEEENRLDSFKSGMDSLHRELQDDYRKIAELEDQISGLSADEYSKIKEYCDDLNKYFDLTNKINELEETSAKLQHYNGYKMVTLKDDLGNDKPIYELATMTYQLFVESRKELSHKLMKNYNSVVEGFDNYIERKKGKYIQPKKSFEDEWLIYKAKFKEYLVNSMRIKDPLIINKLLKEYDKGLFYNDELINMLYRLGYTKSFVDDLVYKFGYCSRPSSLDRDISVKPPKPTTYIFDDVVEEKKEPIKKTFKFKIRNLSNEAKKKITENANRITAFALAGAIVSGGLTIASAKANKTAPIPEAVVVDYIEPELLLDEEVDITEDAAIYENMYDAAYDNNRKTPYFSNDVDRRVMGVVYELDDGELVVANDISQVELYENQRLNKKAVLTGINGEYEGFYKIDNIVKRGIAR